MYSGFFFISYQLLLAFRNDGQDIPIVQIALINLLTVISFQVIQYNANNFQAHL